MVLRELDLVVVEREFVREGLDRERGQFFPDSGRVADVFQNGVVFQETVGVLVIGERDIRTPFVHPKVDEAFALAEATLTEYFLLAHVLQDLDRVFLVVLHAVGDEV